MKNFFLLLFAVILLSLQGIAQEIQGRVLAGEEIYTGKVLLQFKHKDVLISCDTNGRFSQQFRDTGTVILLINTEWHLHYSDTIHIAEKKKYTIGDIVLVPIVKDLQEVEISKYPAVTQSDDTLIYNADAYKINPDADVSDLVKKMPSLEISGQEVIFRGEKVTKVLVDGKPFFGKNAYMTLKILPANIVKSIKAFDEKTARDQFTGFREDPVTKTINIITRKGIDKNLFGNVSAGYGKDNYSTDVYSSDFSLHKFSGDRNVSITGTMNNVNNRNFAAPVAKEMNGNNTGIQKIQNAGINFSDKLGKHSSVALSYLIGNTGNSIASQLTRTYFTPQRSGQLYRELNAARSNSLFHSADVKFDFWIDPYTTLLVQPKINFSVSENVNSIDGNTSRDLMPLNEIRSIINGRQENLSLSNYLLLNRRFKKKGRTLSIGINTIYVNMESEVYLDATNTFFPVVQSDTIAQRSIQQYTAPNWSADINHTEPAGKKGLLKFMIQVSGSRSSSEQGTNNFSDSTHSYSLVDTRLSNELLSTKYTDKTGISYLRQFGRAEWSVLTSYQHSRLKNDQLPVPAVPSEQTFKNLLASTHLNYKLSKQQSLRIDYSAQTQTPTTQQLQEVINNSNPLQLKIGNPALRQSINHRASVNYNALNRQSAGQLSASLSVSVIKNFISPNTIIAVKDSMIKGVNFPEGSLLSVPVNLDGYYDLSFYTNYGVPLPAFKSNINIGFTFLQNSTPGIINNLLNEQSNRSVSIKGQLSSNISQNVDFNIIASYAAKKNKNSINALLSRNYQSANLSGSINIHFPFGLLMNMAFVAQNNKGLNAAYNRNYFLLNASIGKKFLKEQHAEIRFTVFDVLNDNNSIGYIANADYEQITLNRMIQRYFMLILNYKLQSFK